MSSINIREQNNRIVVRRWTYSAEHKGSRGTMIYSVNKYRLPDELPTDVISEREVTQEEHQIFIDFAAKLKADTEKTSSKVALRLLIANLVDAKTALVDPELRDGLTLEQYEELSETINDIKKIITKNKNTIKRRLK
jgi:hypothetical protein